MTSRTHEAGAVAALMLIINQQIPSDLTAQTIIVAMIGLTVGALLPDIDQASNRLWDMLPGGNIIGKILRKIFLGHRTISHSLIGIWLVFEGITWLIPQLLNNNFVDVSMVIYCILIGYGSHLILDGLTEEGLPLLWPFKWKFGFPLIKSWRIKTGRWFENWIVFPGLVIWILILTGRSIFNI